MVAMTSLLSLDLALNAGYAQWTVGAPKANAGLLQIDPSLELGGRLASLYKWALVKVREWEVTDISIEEPLVGNVPGHAKQFYWLISAYGIICMLGAQIKTNGVPINVVPIANATMVVHWLGSRDIEKKLRKTYSVLECQRRGFQKITQHDTADAIGVLSTRCAQLGLCGQTPWDSKRSPGPLFTGLPQPQGTKITKANERTAAILTSRAMSFNRPQDE